MLSSFSSNGMGSRRPTYCTNKQQTHRRERGGGGGRGRRRGVSTLSISAEPSPTLPSHLLDQPEPYVALGVVRGEGTTPAQDTRTSLYPQLQVCTVTCKPHPPLQCVSLARPSPPAPLPLHTRRIQQYRWTGDEAEKYGHFTTQLQADSCSPCSYAFQRSGRRQTYPFPRAICGRGVRSTSPAQAPGAMATASEERPTAGSQPHTCAGMEK